MDSSYTNLNGILNTLIQTSAAAERVFSLMECKPDIEETPKLKGTNTWGHEVENETGWRRPLAFGLKKHIPAK